MHIKWINQCLKPTLSAAYGSMIIWIKISPADCLPYTDYTVEC